jgi:hypothetical protein
MDVMVVVGFLSLSLATAMAAAFGGLRGVLFLITRTRARSGPPPLARSSSRSRDLAVTK